MSFMKTITFKVVLISVAILLFLFPAFIYILKWGVGLWSSHEDWSIMASYFNGIYGPILTAISISFVAYQIKSTSNNNEINRLVEDFARLSLNLKLHINDIGKESIHVLHQEIEVSINNGDNPILGELAYSFYKNKSQLMHSIIGLHLTLNALKRLDYNKYSLMRVNLFSDVERDLFGKLVYIAFKFNLISSDEIMDIP